MQLVLIKYRAPTLDNQFMPLFLYTEPLRVLEENENNVCVTYKDKDYYAFWFNKKYIDRYI